MLYNNGSIQLPNPGLALYFVSSLLIEFQAAPMSQQQPQRSTSVRVAHHTTAEWAGANPKPKEPAHASYDSWGECSHRALRNLWEQQFTMPEEDGAVAGASAPQLPAQVF
jgi:hypothetical protein